MIVGPDPQPNSRPTASAALHLPSSVPAGHGDVPTGRGRFRAVAGARRMAALKTLWRGEHSRVTVSTPTSPGDLDVSAMPAALMRGTRPGPRPGVMAPRAGPAPQNLRSP